MFLEIQAQMCGKDNKSIGISNEMIATIDAPNSLITGPPGIIKFDKEGIAYTVIQNCAPCAIWIEKTDQVGFAKHHTEEAKSEKLDTKYVFHLMQQVSISSIEQEKPKRWTVDAKREHIWEHAKMIMLT